MSEVVEVLDFGLSSLLKLLIRLRTVTIGERLCDFAGCSDVVLSRS